MILREAYNFISTQLTPIFQEQEARSIARLILENISGLEGISFFLNQAQILTPSQELEISQALDKLQKHIPIQHVTGKAWFYSLQFNVNSQVLIPRQETEQLVRLALPQCTAQSQILDLCTGSGCIAIALKKNAPSINITAVDVSIPALDIAQQNAQIHQTEIQFLEQDITLLPQASLNKLWDVIISNPPYIPLAEKESLATQVKNHDPALALFSPKNDDLFFYKAIAHHYLPLLKNTGVMLLEIHAPLAKETAQIFSSLNFHVKIINDIHERERFLQISHK